jgi:hypothetical protein
MRHDPHYVAILIADSCDVVYGTVRIVLKIPEHNLVIP